jgi:hypothetical protein
MANGQSVDDILEIKENRYSVEYKGVVYATRRVLAKTHGIAYHLLSNRLNAGMSLEEALTRPKRASFIFRGVRYRNVESMIEALDLGVTRKQFSNLKHGNPDCANDIEKTVAYIEKRNAEQ